MCDEWVNDFKTFYDWSIENGYKENLTIDRKDNKKGYNPNNCKWSTPKEQANNRRNNLLFTYRGETKTLTQWCEKLNVSYGMIVKRIHKGWDFDKAIETPPLRKKG